MLEPEVKEGEGGLRDIQTARWIARAKLKVKDLDALALNGVVSATDIAALKESQDFLLRVRNELHFSTGKHQDQLTFEHQEKVSSALGFEGEGALRGVEVFMRSYYLHAAQINRLSTLIVHRVTDCDKPRFGATYMFGRTLREGIRLSKGHLTVTKPEVLKSSPENLIRIFDDAQKYNCQLTHETRELLRQHLDLIDDDFRRSAEANLPFFNILKWKESVYETLMEMHRGRRFGRAHSRVRPAALHGVARRLSHLHGGSAFTAIDQRDRTVESRRLRARACRCSPNWRAKPRRSSCFISA